ncbi:MAG: TonB-dependent receptor [Gemmatimonadota bacterium]
MRRFFATLLFLGSTIAATSVAAQSLTNGSVEGVVTDRGGTVADALVTVRRTNGGLPSIVSSGSTGEFHASGLEPGSYNLLVEQLGYRPVLLRGVPVRPGRVVNVQVFLRPVTGIVQAPDTVAFWAGVSGGSVPGQSQHFGAWALDRLPWSYGVIGELAELSSAGGAPLAMEGLPSGLGGVVVDGLPFHTVTSRQSAPLALPQQSVREASDARLLTGRPDVEWPGFAGGVLSLTPGTGAGLVGGKAWGDWSGDALKIDDRGVPFTDWRAGAELGGSVLQDSARVWLMGEGARRQVPHQVWPSDPAGNALASELESAGVPVKTGWTTPLEDRVDAAGSFDWRLGAGRRVGVFGLYSDAKTEYGRGSLFDTPVEASGQSTDLQLGFTLESSLSSSTSVEARAGYTSSRQRFDPPADTISAYGQATVAFPTVSAELGGDPAWARDLNRSDVYGVGTLHVDFEPHRLKLGVAGSTTSHDRTAGWAGLGLYEFADGASLAAGTGTYVSTTEPVPVANFSTSKLALFAQDEWQLAPGFELTTGVRYQRESLPSGKLLGNQHWQQLKGMDARTMPSAASGTGVVVGFDWDVQQRRTLLVRGDYSVQVGEVSPDLLAETLTHDGRVAMQAAVGDVSPGFSPVDLGPRLTILASDFNAPVTNRASFGIARALGASSSLFLSGVLRHTRNLPERRDLNLPTAARYVDQNGRPFYGEPVRVGGLLRAAPGSNRRFAEFDAVSAVSSSATSTYWGITAGLEERVGRVLRFMGSYTYSRTRDDWLGAMGGQPLAALPPFPGSDELGNWADGVSSLDVPQRVALATELTLPFAPVLHIGGRYRLESGRPFTPGMGAAIDANGDGVAGNDPAFVDGAVPGMQSLLDRYDCLRQNAGHFAERNACRDPMRQGVDAWLTLELPGRNGVGARLTVQALNLGGAGGPIHDHALYQLDPNAPLVVDNAAGTITLPLRANPHFGGALYQAADAARARITLTVEF